MDNAQARQFLTEMAQSYPFHAEDLNAVLALVSAPAALPEGEPLAYIRLGGIIHSSSGLELEDCDIEPNMKAIEALQQALVTGDKNQDGLTISLFAAPAPSGVSAPACNPTWCRHCGFQVVLTEPPHPDSNPGVRAPAVNAQPGEQDDPTEPESLIACLEDDAAKLKDEDPDSEVAANMLQAARYIEALEASVGCLERQIENQRAALAHAQIDSAGDANALRPLDDAPAVDGYKVLALTKWEWEKEPRLRILFWNDGIGKVGYTWPCWMCDVNTVEIPESCIIGWLPLPNNAAIAASAATKGGDRD